MEDKKIYPLSEKEKDIVEEAQKEELNASSFYNYLNFCFANYGAENSSEWAYTESKDERLHFKKLTDYLQLRGIEPEMPAIDEPKIPFTDMVSGYLAANKIELTLAEKYEEWIDQLKELPGANMTYKLFMEMLEIQRQAIEDLQRICIQLSALKEKEDQLEWDKMYFSPSLSVEN